jgi:type IV pilus assembly protein PilC
MANKVPPIPFDYEGTTKSGSPVRGKINALSLNLAKAELKRQGIIVKKVKKHQEPLFAFLKKNKIKGADIAIFTRQISTMIAAGIPIVQSLDILARGQTNPQLGDLFNDLKQEIEAGAHFSDALAKHPQYFNGLFCNLVYAGEQSGSLDTMLERIAQYREKIESLKGKIKKALFYPIAVVLIAVVISAGMLIFIVPQFAAIFESFGADLPAPTQFVMMLSRGLQAYWYVFLGVIVAIFFAVKKAKDTSPDFAYKLDALILKIPVIGDILQKAIIARITRTLSTTFAAGMPLVEALGAVAGTSGNILFAQTMNKVKEEVSSGQQINLALKESPLFPPMVIQMIAVGEESGTLEYMLAKIADFYDEQVDNAVNSLSSLLEPIIMVVLGTIIGGLVIAMYLPIFKLGGVVSG